MGKIVKDSYRVGEAGVIEFNRYCNHHNPFIIFREVTKHDFGIDGELELTKKNADGKIEATAEILKVQIKSVNSDNSYIRNEKENSFDFYADNNDIDYWLKHKKFNLPVLLIIVDLRNDNTIYVKRITELELNSVKKKGSAIPIQFDKEKNRLILGKNDFIERFSNSFKSRIDYDLEETLMANCLLVKSFPKVMYTYKSKFKTKKEIFNHVSNEDAPHFVLKSDKIYSFIEITPNSCAKFYKEIIEESRLDIIHFRTFAIEQELYNIFLELFHEHLKHELYPRLLSYSKDYSRFYFRIKEEQEILEVDSRTRKRDQSSKKKVVTYHKYGQTEFFRHLAVELKVKLIDNQILLIVNPKYLFTKDRKEPLKPKQITKYTNYLTSRERNNEYSNSLHFWKTYLFKGQEQWEIYASDNSKFVIADYKIFHVRFGITLDVKAVKKKNESKPINSQQQFTFDED